PGGSEGGRGGRGGWGGREARRGEGIAFRNRGNLRFDNVAEEWGLGFLGTSYGAALGDLDGDGDLDIVTINFEDPAHVYRNLESQARRAVVKLVGTRSNRGGIGAVVEVQAGGVRQVRDLPCVRGFMSADEPKLFFGLGEAKVIDRLTVRWPSGVVQQFQDLPVDHEFTVTESGEPAAEREGNNTNAPLFEKVKRLPKVVHRESDFDDFQEQPSLPGRLSRLGPGVACGDVNGDGFDDFYVAGARGQAGSLMMGLSSGLMEDYRSRTTFEESIDGEEMAPLFFDADGDGDLDLYVVHGGNEVPPGDPTLQDQLYLNSGKGVFAQAAEDALPDMTMSGSTVVAADFDHDGDLDLFVGGRQTPGAYPETPRSALLRNNRGVFEDVTAELAPGLAAVGLVTGALWSDADHDGWPDLLVTCEWGPVAFWRNEQGRLVDATAEAGLAQLTGWWNGIAGGDLDHDGDTDYVVTNLGLNTKHHASPEQPAVLYYGDMDDNGRKDLVEAMYDNGVLLPVRGKTASLSAVPALEEKCETFHDFASQTLGELYGEDKLAAAIRLEASTLESGVLLNQGGGTFQFRPLPRIAQVSPGFGAVVFDANADGHQDVYLVQNFYSSNRETVRMDGGVSQLLLGDGAGRLRPVAPCLQGMIVPGDAKGAAVADINHDARPDVLVTNNNGPLQAFQNQAAPGQRFLAIRLAGPPGNPTGVGARVTVERAGGPRQVFERHCGGGYLSQSSPTLFVGLGDDQQQAVVTVEWPDGAKRQLTTPPDATRVTVEY
ncbi:MAG: VCBS repeat-containing protein, partial [Planctomycetales bacterium]|nr:VCBS repeat-containing protein [Planctomycetales bacterium]